jgi:hypothetical protein
MKSRNEIAQALILVMCLMVSSSGFAAKGDEVLAPVVAVKRTTTLNLAKLLKTCAIDQSAPKEMPMIKCQLVDERSAPTDVYPSPMITIAKMDFDSGPFRGSISISILGSKGVWVVGYPSGSGSLEDMKKGVTYLFEENKLEGKDVEFYAHVIEDKKD